MAKPIEIGLVLGGEDARRFHKYMEDPKITKEGRNLIREAIKIAKKEKRLSDFSLRMFVQSSAHRRLI